MSKLTVLGAALAALLLSVGCGNYGYPVVDCIKFNGEHLRLVMTDHYEGKTTGYDSKGNWRRIYCEEVIHTGKRYIQ